jgi:hypothetical protein
LQQLAGVVAAPVVGIFSGFLLLFGGVFLGVAWLCGPQQLLDSHNYRPFTAHASGRIVESWVALEFDPTALPTGKLYWQPYAKIQPCAVVAYAGDWGETRRAFCGNRFQFREDFRLEDWQTLAPGVPFEFQHDASGFEQPEVRLSKAAMDWLSAHPPSDTFMLSKPPPPTALAALREQFDHPLDIAAASWTARNTDIPLAFDPQHPDQALPERIVADRQSFSWLAFIFTALLAIPGVYVWRLGMALLTGQSGRLLWLLALAPLVALPWWSDFLPQLIRHANKDWADVVTGMLDDINRVTRFSATAPANALLASGQRLQWTPATSAYADSFGRVQFALPQPPPATRNAALAALREQARARVLQWSAADQAALFVRLREQYEANAQQVQSVFTVAAEDILRNGNTDAAAHRAARNFLIFASGGTYYDDQLDKIEVQPRSQ